MAKLTANDVANFFLTLSQPEEGDYITNLKLQKLIYYAQGFSLALFDKELFSEEIYAWMHGPVVPEVYKLFNSNESTDIPVPKEIYLTIFSEDQSSILKEVWDVYGQFSAWKLRNMTHEESPWKDTKQDEVISKDSLRSFFKTRINQDWLLLPLTDEESILCEGS